MKQRSNPVPIVILAASLWSVNCVAGADNSKLLAANLANSMKAVTAKLGYELRIEIENCSMGRAYVCEALAQQMHSSATLSFLLSFKTAAEPLDLVAIPLANKSNPLILYQSIAVSLSVLGAGEVDIDALRVEVAALMDAAQVTNHSQDIVVGGVTITATPMLGIAMALTIRRY